MVYTLTNPSPRVHGLAPLKAHEFALVTSHKTWTRRTCGRWDTSLKRCVFTVVRFFSIWKMKKYLFVLKNGSLDNAIREFLLAQPWWVMSHYTKYGERTRFWGVYLFLFWLSFLYLGGVFIKQLFHSRLLDIRWLWPTRRYTRQDKTRQLY